MSVAAAIRITSEDEERVIRHAAEFAQQRHEPCFVISIVRKLPYDAANDEQRRTVMKNLELITAAQASPVMQEGDDVAKAILAVARAFGIRTLFLQSGSSRLLGRSIAERILYLQPPFDVVVISSE